MMWKQRLTTLADHCKSHPPLSEDWIDKGLVDLGVTLNSDFKSFLLETDGLYDYKQFLWIVWNVRDLSAYNHEMRNHQDFADQGYRFDDIVFIANRGDGGILFGFPIVDGIMQEQIVMWQPKTGERIVIANDLQEYLNKWIANKLK